MESEFRRLPSVDRLLSGELYIKQVIKVIEEGGLPKQTTKTLQKELSKELNPIKILVPGCVIK